MTVKKLVMEYHRSTTASAMTSYRISPYLVQNFPHHVKVHGIWHTEISIRLTDWITSAGGTRENFHSTLSEFMFADEDLCMLFIVRFRGVPVDDIYKR